MGIYLFRSPLDPYLCHFCLYPICTPHQVFSVYMVYVSQLVLLFWPFLLYIFLLLCLLYHFALVFFWPFLALVFWPLSLYTALQWYQHYFYHLLACHLRLFCLYQYLHHLVPFVFAF